MARINIEEKWWHDERRLSLIDRIGSRFLVDGLWWNLVHAAQLNATAENNYCISEKLFTAFPHFADLIAVGLVEKTEQGYYVAGTRDHFAWLKSRSDNGRKGGLAKASTCLAPSSNSLASSSSSSSKKKNNTLSDPADQTADEGWDLERIYRAYPRRDGDMKKGAGLKRLKAIVKNQTDYDLALLAVQNYNSYCVKNKKVKTETVKMFSSFFDSLGDWKEWAEKKQKSEFQEMTIEQIRKLGAGV